MLSRLACRKVFLSARPLSVVHKTFSTTASENTYVEVCRASPEDTLRSEASIKKYEARLEAAVAAFNRLVDEKDRIDLNSLRQEHVALGAVGEEDEDEVEVVENEEKKEDEDKVEIVENEEKEEDDEIKELEDEVESEDEGDFKELITNVENVSFHIMEMGDKIESLNASGIQPKGEELLDDKAMQEEMVLLAKEVQQMIKKIRNKQDLPLKDKDGNEIMVEYEGRMMSMKDAIAEADKIDDYVNMTEEKKENLECSAPCRHGFIPEEWFRFFYDKTGISGPYVFMGTLGTYLLSKEFYVLEHEFYNSISLLMIVIILVKKLGPAVSKALDEKAEMLIQQCNAPKERALKILELLLARVEKKKWRAEGRPVVFDVVKTNIAVQLEAAYRERLMHVYNEVKCRLDYHSQIDSLERKLAQQHMVQWVIKSVIQSITPDQEKANLQQCIKDLEGLAATA